MQNPFIDTLAKGGSTASQTANVASGFMRNSINAFNSAGSLSVKMLALLEQEEARRNQQLIQQTKLMQDAYFNVLDQEMKQKKLLLEQEKFNEAKRQFEANYDLAVEQSKWSKEYQQKQLELQEWINVNKQEMITVEVPNNTGGYDKKVMIINIPYRCNKKTGDCIRLFGDNNSLSQINKDNLMQQNNISLINQNNNNINSIFNNTQSELPKKKTDEINQQIFGNNWNNGLIPTTLASIGDPKNLVQSNDSKIFTNSSNPLINEYSMYINLLEKNSPIKIREGNDGYTIYYGNVDFNTQLVQVSGDKVRINDKLMKKILSNSTPEQRNFLLFAIGENLLKNMKVDASLGTNQITKYVNVINRLKDYFVPDLIKGNKKTFEKFKWLLTYSVANKLSLSKLDIDKRNELFKKLTIDIDDDNMRDEIAKILGSPYFLDKYLKSETFLKDFYGYINAQNPISVFFEDVATYFGIDSYNVEGTKAFADTPQEMMDLLRKGIKYGTSKLLTDGIHPKHFEKVLSEYFDRNEFLFGVKSWRRVAGFGEFHNDVLEDIVKKDKIIQKNRFLQNPLRIGKNSRRKKVVYIDQSEKDYIKNTIVNIMRHKPEEIPSKIVLPLSNGKTLKITKEEFYDIFVNDIYIPAIKNGLNKGL